MAKKTSSDPMNDPMYAAMSQQKAEHDRLYPPAAIPAGEKLYHAMAKSRADYNAKASKPKSKK